MSAHDSQLFKVPDNVSDELAVFADPFAVSLHSITRHPPTPGGKVMVYGAGALGTCATAILRALYPDVEVLVVARFEAQAEMARKLGAKVIGHSPASQVIEEAAAWSGGVLRASDGLPMAFPGFIDVVYDTVGKQETFEVGTRVLKARGTLVKAGVHGPTWWEDTPLYFKEISMVGSNAFGFEEVEGVRKHGIDHYLDLVSSGRIDLTGMLTHTFPLDGWRDAFTALATQDDSGAIKVAFDYRTGRVDERRRPRRHRGPRRRHHDQPSRPAQRVEPRRAARAARRRSRSCDADDDVDVMILTGADPAFSAGVDLKEFGSGQVQQGESFGGVAESRDSFRGALPPHTKPLIGAVNGVAVTGGFEVALNCDFLIASDRARFADTHARVGVMPGWGLTVLLAQRIGVARAKQMSFTGNYLDAQTACEWGLVNEVVAARRAAPVLPQARGRHRLERPDGRAPHVAHLRRGHGDDRRRGLGDRGPREPRVGRSRLRPREHRVAPHEDRRTRPLPDPTLTESRQQLGGKAARGPVSAQLLARFTRHDCGRRVW